MDEQKIKREFSYHGSFADSGFVLLLVGFLVLGPFFTGKGIHGFFLSSLVAVLVVYLIAASLTGYIERIILENDELMWISALGRKKARIPLSAIGPESLDARPHFFLTVHPDFSSKGYRLQAEGQTIWFSSKLSGVGKLLEVILKRAYLVKAPTVPPIPDPNPALGTHTYGGDGKLNLILCGVMAPVMFFLAGSDFFKGTEDHFIVLEFALIGLMFLGMCWRFYGWFFQRIVVSQEGVQLKDWRGRVKLDLAFSDFIPGTMDWRWRSDGWSTGVAQYRIQTIKGDLAWTGQLKDCARLNFLLRDVARQPFLPIPTLALPVYPGAMPGVRESALKRTQP
ncbi:MAG TPA: hypothetical protein VGL56_03685 [Fimbriimonadaceae bacterium]